MKCTLPYVLCEGCYRKRFCDQKQTRYLCNIAVFPLMEPPKKKLIPPSSNSTTIVMVVYALPFLSRVIPCAIVIQNPCPATSISTLKVALLPQLRSVRPSPHLLLCLRLFLPLFLRLFLPLFLPLFRLRPHRMSPFPFLSPPSPSLSPLLCPPPRPYRPLLSPLLCPPPSLCRPLLSLPPSCRSPSPTSLLSPRWTPAWTTCWATRA